MNVLFKKSYADIPNSKSFHVFNYVFLNVNIDV